MDETLLSTVQNGRYEIRANDGGVYLSVWGPAAGGLPVSKTAIIQDLISRHCSNFDSDFIAVVIREAMGTPVQIVNSLPPLDGRYRISANDAGVYLSVWGPANSGVPVTKQAIIKDLIERNCTGFDSDFIAVVIREAIGAPVQIINSLPKVDGRYEIYANDAGVYLSVWGPGHGGWPVAKATIIQDLTKRNCANFDNDFIALIIREAVGKPVLIVNSQTAAGSVSPAIRVKVGLDRMEARLTIYRPKEQAGPAITSEQLLAELRSAGVVFGIEAAALAEISQTGRATNTICARGMPPCDGEPAKLKFFIDPDSQGRPVELEDGRVDFKETNNFLCVEEGQLLVEKMPATAGIPGTDVYGLPLPAKPGKDLRLPGGENVINVDEWRLYAAINGHLQIFLDKRINVIPIIIIDGDVDYSTGNIDFKGSIIVRGSIQQDFAVKASGNVEVCGTIAGGRVEANSIIVRKGIQGMKRSVIKARERVVTNFIENATVYADEDIIVNDVILNSTVFAGQRVIVEGRRGLIRGGRVAAGEVVRATTIGNPCGVSTEVEVAVDWILKDELLNLGQEIKKAEAAYDNLQLSLTHMRNQGIENLAGEKRERYKQQAAEYQALPDRLEEMKQRAANIENLLVSLKPGRIRVCNYIYPRTRISIGALTKNINEPLQFISFYALGREIKFASLR